MVADDVKSRRRRLSKDERALWGKVTHSVAPLKRRQAQADSADSDDTGRNVKAKPQARAAAATLQHSSAAVAALAAPKRKPAPLPLERRVKQRLARGSEPIDARIDLHGRTQSDAHAALARFVRRASADGHRFVLVITGKGGRADEVSNERGVLKRHVPLWLRLPEFSSYVVGFTEAGRAHGGTGALYVRLRRHPRGE